MKEEALKKIAKEKEAIGMASADSMELIISVWISRHPAAAQDVLDEKKTLSGCLEFMKSKAKPKAVRGCYEPKQEEAVAWILEYYGLTPEQAQAEIENGLMFAILMEEADRWRPFENSPAAEPPKPQATAAVADLFGGMLDDL